MIKVLGSSNGVVVQEKLIIIFHDFFKYLIYYYKFDINR